MKSWFAVCLFAVQATLHNNLREDGIAGVGQSGHNLKHADEGDQRKLASQHNAVDEGDQRKLASQRHAVDESDQRKLASERHTVDESDQVSQRHAAKMVESHAQRAKWGNPLTSTAVGLTPWTDPITLANKKLLKDFQVKVTNSDNLAMDAIHTLSYEYQKTFADSLKKMVFGQNTIENEAGTLEIEGRDMTDRATEDKVRLKPPIRFEKKEAKAAKKYHAKKMKKTERNYDKSRKSDEKIFKKNLKGSEKYFKRWTKKADKDIKNMGKAYGKRQKKDMNAVIKRYEVAKKSLAKDEVKMDKRSDSMKERLNEAVEGYMSSTAETDMVAGSLEDLVDKALSSEDVTRMGMYPANERAEEIRSHFLDVSADEIDNAESQSMIRLSNINDEIVDQVKASYAENGATAYKADKQMAKDAIEGEDNVDNFIGEMGLTQDEISTGVDKEKKEELKITKRFTKTKQALGNEIREGQQDVNKVEQDVGDRLVDYASTMTKGVNDIENQEFNDISNKRNLNNALTDKLYRFGSSQVEMGTAQAGNDFGSDLAQSVGEINQIGSTLQNSVMLEQKTNNVLGQMKKSEANVETGVHLLPTIATFASTEAKDTTTEASKILSGDEGKLHEAQTEQDTFIKRDMSGAQKVMGKATVEVIDSLNGLTEKGSTEVDKFVDESTTERKTMQRTGSTVSTANARNSATLTKINSELQDASKAGKMLKLNGMEEVSKLQSNMNDNMKAVDHELKEDLKRSEDDNDRMITDTHEAMEHGVATELSQMQGQAKAVQGLITELDRTQTTQQSINDGRINQVSQNLNDEITKIDALQGTLKTNQAKRFALIGEAEQNMTDARKENAHLRSGLRDHILAETEADGEEILSNNRAGMEDMENSVAQSTGAVEKKLDTGRSEKMDEMVNSESAVQRLVLTAEGRVNSIAKQSDAFNSFMDKNQDGSNALIGAQESLVIMRGGSDAERAAARQMDEETAAAEKKMSDEVNFNNQHARESLNNANTAMNGDLTESRQFYAAGRDQLDRDRKKEAGEFGKAVYGQTAKDAEIDRAAAAAKQQTELDLRRGESEVKREEQIVTGAERKEMLELQSDSQREDRARAEALREANGINSDLKSQGNAVEGELKDVSAQGTHALQNLDPAQKLKIGLREFMSLKEMRGMSDSKLSEYYKELNGVTGDTEGIVSRQTMMNAVILSSIQKGIIKQAQENLDVMEPVHERFDETKEMMTDLPNEMIEITQDLGTSVQGKIGRVSDKVKAIQDDVDYGMSLAKYQGEEALGKVEKVIMKSQNETNILTAHKDNVIVPNTEAYRLEMQRVFESMGYGLDMERINRLAAESMAAEGGTGVILTAEQQIALKMRQIQDQLARDMRAVEAKLAADIAAIMGRSDLSHAEKMALIKKLREQAEIDKLALVRNAKKLLSEQRAMMHGIDEDMAKLDSILAQAEQLKNNGDQSAMSARLVKQLETDMRRKLEEVRQKFLLGDSLLEVKEFEKKSHNALKASETPVKKFQEAEAAMETLDNMREPEDHEWEHSLSLMENALHNYQT